MVRIISLDMDNCILNKEYKEQGSKDIFAPNAGLINKLKDQAQQEPMVLYLGSNRQSRQADSVMASGHSHSGIEALLLIHEELNKSSKVALNPLLLADVQNATINAYLGPNAQTMSSVLGEVRQIGSSFNDIQKDMTACRAYEKALNDAYIAYKESAENHDDVLMYLAPENRQFPHPLSEENISSSGLSTSIAAAFPDTSRLSYLESNLYKAATDLVDFQTKYYDEHFESAERTSDYLFDEQKFCILYAQMHDAATAYPNQKIEFDFYDDRKDILDKLNVFFEKNPSLMPENVTLNLYQYAASGDENTCIHKAKGSGAVDKHYGDTLRGILCSDCYKSTHNVGRSKYSDSKVIMDDKLFQTICEIRPDVLGNQKDSGGPASESANHVQPDVPSPKARESMSVADVLFGPIGDTAVLPIAAADLVKDVAQSRVEKVSDGNEQLKDAVLREVRRIGVDTNKGKRIEAALNKLGDKLVSAAVKDQNSELYKALNEKRMGPLTISLKGGISTKSQALLNVLADVDKVENESQGNLAFRT